MKTFTFLGLAILFGMQGVSSVNAQGTDISRPHFPRILVLSDTSGSLDRAEYASVVSLLGTQLVELAIDVGARDVGLLPWAGSGDVLKSARWVRLPARPVIPVTVVQFTEGESIFKGPQELLKARVASLTAARTAAADSCFREQIRVALGPLRSALASSAQGNASVTDVTGALLRCSHESAGTLTLLVTDAVQEGVEPLHRVPEPRTGNCTIVVLAPTREHGGDTASSQEARTQWLHEIAPWVRVLRSFELSSTPDEWLLPLLREDPRSKTFEAAGLGASR